MRDEKLLAMDLTPQGQIKAINQTFTAAAKASLSSLKHPTNPDLKPLEIIPIFPDFENWPNQYYLASYPSDPTNRASSAQQAAVPYFPLFRYRENVISIYDISRTHQKIIRLLWKKLFSSLLKIQMTRMKIG